MNIHSIPNAAPSDIIEWSRICGIRVDGHAFNPDRIPQLIEPLKAGVDSTIRNCTLVKPVQTGGSTVGEILMSFWLCFYRGLLQFNWQDDLRARERWGTRLLDVLRSVLELKWSGEKYDEKIGDAKFINSHLIVQGVLASGALDSETVPMQLNEEIHLWPPGTLAKARRRQTLVWNSKSFDISNAGIVGDQLEAAWEDGSMEVWEVLCPGCGQYHEMRFRWNDKKPELGGLRFDTSAGRMASGKYSLNKVVPTIRYQMPCGFIVHDTPSERRALVGSYRKTNDGALEYKRSWTYEAVSVSEIKWPELVGEWLTACKAMKSGDREPIKKFVQERECRFFDPDSDVPFSSQIIINTAIKKNREGLRSAPNFAGRFGIADWQQGYKSKGELTHYWGACEDILQNCNSQIVWEGMIATDAELTAQWDELDIPNENRFVDCSKNTADILSMCYRDGMNALSGIVSHKGSFLHKDKVRRWYSEPKFIYKERNLAPKYPDEFWQNAEGLHPGFREPFIIEYNKAGLLANFFFLRDMRTNVLKNNPKATAADYIERNIPGDVSEEFKEQCDSWERITTKQIKTNDDIEGFRKIRRADHFLMVLAYLDLIKEFSGLLPDQLSRMGIREMEQK